LTIHLPRCSSVAKLSGSRCSLGLLHVHAAASRVVGNKSKSGKRCTVGFWRRVDPNRSQLQTRVRTSLRYGLHQIERIAGVPAHRPLTRASGRSDFDSLAKIRISEMSLWGKIDDNSSCCIKPFCHLPSLAFALQLVSSPSQAYSAQTSRACT
jgi:hypothetical protein